MADALAECGANVGVCARKAERCEQAAAEIEANGVRRSAWAATCASPGQVEAVVARDGEQFGGVDILVNNAGVSWAAIAGGHPTRGLAEGDRRQPDRRLPLRAGGRPPDDREAERRQDRQHRVGARRARDRPGGAERAAVQHDQGRRRQLHARPGGEVGAAQHPRQRDRAGLVPDGHVRAGLEQAGERLLANIPLGRFGSPDDLKGAVVYLASAASDFVTGTTLFVDGGQSAG